MFFCLTHIALTLFSKKLSLINNMLIMNIFQLNQELFLKRNEFFLIKM